MGWCGVLELMTSFQIDLLYNNWMVIHAATATGLKEDGRVRRTLFNKYLDVNGMSFKITILVFILFQHILHLNVGHELINQNG